MDTSQILMILQILLCLLGIAGGKQFVRLCYFPNWAGERPSQFARFNIEDIDPTLCSHLVYAFANVDKDSHRIVPLQPAVEDPPINVGKYQQFNDIKKRYSHVKTLLSIGGEYAGSDKFLAVTRDPNALNRFASTTVQFLRQKNFDGLDVDWEYPNATTKADFSKLLKRLRAAFDDEKRQNGEERLLLTAALPAGRQHIDNAYIMGDVASYVDLANLMTYDYHGSWNDITGFDSPLFSRVSDPMFNNELSTEWTVDYYMSKGLPASKILVGVTAAGTRYQLKNSSLFGVGAPVVKADKPRLSDIWQLPDRYAYPEVCRFLQSSHARRVFDEEQKVPYAYDNNVTRTWIGYEDVQSLKLKVDWMLKKGVAGAMFWALDMDDFTGRMCDSGKFPLLRALRHSVKLEENTHLTDNVNPNIRYLTKAENAAPLTASSLHGTFVFAAVVGAFITKLFSWCR